MLGFFTSEYPQFCVLLPATYKSMTPPPKTFDEVDVSTRAIQRKMHDVQHLHTPDTGVPLGRGHTAALTGLDPEDDLT